VIDSDVQNGDMDDQPQNDEETVSANKCDDCSLILEEIQTVKKMLGDYTVNYSIWHHLEEGFRETHREISEVRMDISKYDGISEELERIRAFASEMGYQCQLAAEYLKNAIKDAMNEARAAVTANSAAAGISLTISEAIESFQAFAGVYDGMVKAVETIRDLSLENAQLAQISSSNLQVINENMSDLLKNNNNNTSLRKLETVLNSVNLLMTSILTGHMIKEKKEKEKPQVVW